MQNNLKKGLFYLLMIVISLPLIQQFVGVAYVVPLKGSVKLVNAPKLSYESWFNGNYQKQADRYINGSFGFRPAFVRLHNQIDYWLFKKPNANNVIIGKEDYLYEYNYIADYLGLNFSGKNQISEKIGKLKSVSDSLSVRDIDIVVLLAAGKASFFNEYFPDSMNHYPKRMSNYEYISYSLDSAGLNYIDFNDWFVKMKDTSRYPLFPKGGIHWSKYGEYLVADSLIKYVEELKGVKLPYYQVLEIEVSDRPKFRDNDIGDGMNLIFSNPVFPMAYPEKQVVVPDKASKMTAAFVADSYYWELYNDGLLGDIFNRGQFWYYNRQIHSPDPGWTRTDVDNVDIRWEVEKNDVIFILQTEATLYRFGFNFIERLYEAYKDPTYRPDSGYLQDQEVNMIIEKIKANPNWYNNIVEKAKTRNIKIEEMLKRDALYMIRARKEKENK